MSYYDRDLFWVNEKKLAFNSILNSFKMCFIQYIEGSCEVPFASLGPIYILASKELIFLMNY